MNRDSETAPDSNREALLQAAKTLFGSQGYDGTTVRQVAELAKVNISLVSYYFQGKEGLYRACLDQFGRNRLDVAKRILVKTDEPNEFWLRLKMFIEEMINSHILEPDLYKMVHREMELGANIVPDIFEKFFLETFKTVIAFVKSGIESGLLRDDLEDKAMAGMIFSTITNYCRADQVSKKYFGQTLTDKKYRERVIALIHSVFKEGMSKD